MKNKPVQVNLSFLTSHAALRGTALCILRFLPLILGNQIHEENEDWEHLLQCQEIIDIFFDLKCQQNASRTWMCSCKLFLEFAEQYSTSAITPKLHYLVHYARLVQESVPLKHFLSMRFEAKHSYFKHLVTSVKNF